MERRNFIRNTVAAGAGIAGLSIQAASAENKGNQLFTKADKPFNMKFAPHFGMFENDGSMTLTDQVQLMYDHGFRAIEDNGMKGKSVNDQEKIASKMANLGMDMGVFVAHKIYWREPNLASGNEERREEFLSDIKSSVEVAKRVNARWMTVVPGHLDLHLDLGYQTVNVVETLKRACEILEPHNITMVLEPLNPRNHPGLFLSKMSHAYEICNAVGSPSCKILCDLYHQQITEGNLIPNIDASYEEIGYFQIGDNPGRKEPTTGEINYKNVFKHIQSKGFTGILGMEHGKSKGGKEGDEALLKAYRSVDVNE